MEYSIEKNDIPSNTISKMEYLTEYHFFLKFTRRKIKFNLINIFLNAAVTLSATPAFYFLGRLGYIYRHKRNI